jgi:presqualene diphosphate synthase
MSDATVAAPRRSSFYTAMRVLSREKREAMYEIYNFCRAVDDIADDTARPRPDRHAELQAWRDDVDRLYAGAVPERLASLAKAIRDYDLKRENFLAIIDGMDMDVAADIRAPDRATFDLYCDRVACAVGRLSTQVFGLDEKTGAALADHLGRALQVTNILRDLDEDASFGRLYLPRDALDRAGIASNDPQAVLANPALDVAAQSLVAEARMRFEKANAVMATCSRARTRAPRLMAIVYRKILDQVAARGFAPPRAPVSVSKAGLIFAALRGFF